MTASDTRLASELRVSLARLTRRLRAERASDDELTLSQRSVLGLLLRDGEQTVGRLADAEGVRPPSMTRTVGCLADAGFVVRRPHPTDGRVVLVDATPRGRETLLADRRRRDAWLARRLTDLTAAERDTLRAAAPILERLADTT